MLSALDLVGLIHPAGSALVRAKRTSELRAQESELFEQRLRSNEQSIRHREESRAESKKVVAAQLKQIDSSMALAEKDFKLRRTAIYAGIASTVVPGVTKGVVKGYRGLKNFKTNRALANTTANYNAAYGAATRYIPPPVHNYDR